MMDETGLFYLQRVVNKIQKIQKLYTLFTVNFPQFLLLLHFLSLTENLGNSPDFANLKSASNT